MTSPTQQQQEESTTFTPTTAMNTPATPGNLLIIAFMIDYNLEVQIWFCEYN